MHHMMTRYMLWNYAGREGWSQDAQAANIAPFNGVGNIFGKLFAVNLKGMLKIHYSVSSSAWVVRYLLSFPAGLENGCRIYGDVYSSWVILLLSIRISSSRSRGKEIIFM
jgi:hypothetical protein